MESEAELANMYDTSEFKPLFSNAGLRYLGVDALNPSEEIHIGKK